LIAGLKPGVRDPNVQLVLFDDSDYRLDNIFLKHSLFEHGKIRLTKSPPLNAAIAVVSLSGSISICIPRGGRPLVIAKAIPCIAHFVHRGLSHGRRPR
jgi:hypothetical protein